MKLLLTFIATLCICHSHTYAQINRPELVDAYCYDDCISPAPLIMGSINNQLMVATSLSSFSNGRTINLVHTYTPTGLLRTDSFGDKHPYMFISPIIYNNVFYYWGNISGGDYNLCRWDGMNPPQALTIQVTPGNIVAYNNNLYYSGKNGTGYTFYRYDLNTGTETAINDKMLTLGIVYKNKIYYSMDDGNHGAELYSFDPLTKELALVADINPGPKASYPYYFTVAEDKLYFTATIDTTHNNVFVYDGIHLPERVFSLAQQQTGSLAKRLNDIYYAYGNLYITFGWAMGIIPAIYEYNIENGTAKKISNTFSNHIYNNVIAYRGEILYTASDTVEHVYAYNPKTAVTRQIPDPREITGNNMLRNYVYNDALYYTVNSREIMAGLFKYDEPIPYTPGTTLYPNPASNSVFIKTGLDTNNVLTLIMHDATGREVMQQRLGIYNKGNHTIEIPLQHLAAGMYICTLRGSKNILFKGKLVKL